MCPRYDGPEHANCGREASTASTNGAFEAEEEFVEWPRGEIHTKKKEQLTWKYRKIEGIECVWKW